MSYRAWPAALLTGASLAAACLVVGDHVVATSDGCLDSAGWFTATPAAWPASANEADTGGKPEPDDNDNDYIDEAGDPAEVGRTSEDRPAEGEQISGCLDLDRIEIPAPAPAPDGRA